jgi:hypothetical protein
MEFYAVPYCGAVCGVDVDGRQYKRGSAFRIGNVSLPGDTRRDSDG